MIIVMASRDADDHVKWLLQHGYFEKALAAAEEGNAKSELLEEVLRCPSLDSTSLFLSLIRHGFCIYTFDNMGVYIIRSLARHLLFFLSHYCLFSLDL